MKNIDKKVHPDSKLAVAINEIICEITLDYMLVCYACIKWPIRNQVRKSLISDF